MHKLECSENKVLKLEKVLVCKVLFDENFDFKIVIEKMRAYIKTKGTKVVGPLIQYSRTTVNEQGEPEIDIKFMLQCRDYIHSVEIPYNMNSTIRISSCMYCRYIGPEDKLRFAYDKIHLEAFENDIELEDYNYTIFVDRNEEDETIVADVFIPRKAGK